MSIRTREEMIDLLTELGMFDETMLADVNRRLIATGENPEARQAMYQKWENFCRPIARLGEGVPMSPTPVTSRILAEYDLYGLEFLLEDAQNVGVKLTYARLLEATLQGTTGKGNAYVEARRMQRLSWKNIYLVLRYEGWDPFRPPSAETTPDCVAASGGGTADANTK